MTSRGHTTWDNLADTLLAGTLDSHPGDRQGHLFQNINSPPPNSQDEVLSIFMIVRLSPGLRFLIIHLVLMVEGDSNRTFLNGTNFSQGAFKT